MMQSMMTRGGKYTELRRGAHGCFICHRADHPPSIPLVLYALVSMLRSATSSSPECRAFCWGFRR